MAEDMDGRPQEGPWRPRVGPGALSSTDRATWAEQQVGPLYAPVQTVEVTRLGLADWMVQCWYAPGWPASTLQDKFSRSFWTRRGARRFAARLLRDGVEVEPGHTELWLL